MFLFMFELIFCFDLPDTLTNIRLVGANVLLGGGLLELINRKGVSDKKYTFQTAFILASTMSRVVVLLPQTTVSSIGVLCKRLFVSV